MKRVICTLLCVALAMCFVSCKAQKKGDEKSTSSKAESTSVSQTETTQKRESDYESEIIPQDGEDVRITVLKDKKEFKLGKCSENGYVNESAGFKISGLDSNWSESTPQQIATIFDSGVDPSTGKAYSSNSDDGSQNYLYDVMYTNERTDEVISVSILEYSGDGEGLDDEIPMSATSNEMTGFNDSAELIYLNFAGKKVACKKIRYIKQNNVAKIPNLTEYEIYMMSASYRQVIKIVVVCFDGQPNIDDILKNFSAVEAK